MRDFQTAWLFIGMTIVDDSTVTLVRRRKAADQGNALLFDRFLKRLRKWLAFLIRLMM